MMSLMYKSSKNGENLGNGQTHIDYPKEDETTSSDANGITVTGISAGYRFGEETRPKNMRMRAIFIMRAKIPRMAHQPAGAF